MKHQILLCSAVALIGAPAVAQAPLAGAHDHTTHSAASAPTAPAQDAAKQLDHSSHDMGGMSHAMPGMASPAPAADDMAAMDHSGHAMASTGLFGAYPMTRDASGTSWQPDTSAHGGVHATRGDWQVMGHAAFNAVYDSQGGARGADKAFLAGMVMGAARRDSADGGVINLRAMLSPDPLMGKRGYPLLLAAGETADGAQTLVDRQHPHDLFMELSASYSRAVSQTDSLFVYAGLPGEPAFGPPAFMHRLAAQDSPEAPITHHWLDSTHITFGVLTAGWIHRDWKLEASRFKGREPDQHRYDIEQPRLDSSAVRVSWNPSAAWSLQTSWAELHSPEALSPEADETRWSASAIYTRVVGDNGLWSSTAAWGRKRRTGGEISDAHVLETAFKPNPDWTLFARAERLETDELDPHSTTPSGPAHGEMQTVAKLAMGAIRDWRISPHAKIGLGVLAAFHSIPGELEHAYGASPKSAMGFLRLVID